MGSNAEYSRRWRERNPEKSRASVRAWRGRNPENELDGHLRRKYGISLEEYNAMLTLQGGVCAICQEAPTKRRLDVDHDHETDKVRGLLCMPCNRALGGFKDDPALLSRATKYLIGGDANV